MFLFTIGYVKKPKKTGGVYPPRLNTVLISLKITKKLTKTAMSKEYSSVFSREHGGWCVFKKLTYSIRLFHVKCSDEEEADHVADQLNLEFDKECGSDAKK